MPLNASQFVPARTGNAGVHPTYGPQVIAHQKGLMGLVVCTIGLQRARIKIGLARHA